MEQNELLDANLDNNTREPMHGRRRDLLPKWIKVFTWFFLFLGIIAPLGLFAGLLNVPFQVSLYGLSTHNPLSLLGVFLTLLFLFKGIVAFGLWTEKDWAIQLGEIDAFLGITICVLTMLFLPLLNTKNGCKLDFRIELLVLVPYYLKLRQIKFDW
jgi:hypothetical protein